MDVCIIGRYDFVRLEVEIMGMPCRIGPHDGEVWKLIVGEGRSVIRLCDVAIHRICSDHVLKGVHEFDQSVDQIEEISCISNPPSLYRHPARRFRFVIDLEPIPAAT